MYSRFILGNLTYMFRAAVDFIFRRHSTGLWLIRAGVGLLALLLAGWAVGIRVPTQRGPFILNISTASTVPEFISSGILLVGLALILFGSILTWHEHRERSRKRVIAIEIRGLRDTSGEPLASALPGRLIGRREQILVDVRQGLQDGKIVDPAVALGRIQSLPHEIAGRIAGLDREDITFALAGLAPVPLSFLAGVISDDEGPVTLLDWNRHLQSWCTLDEADDGNRFQISGLEKVQSGAPDVCLAVSVSYQVDLPGVAAKIPGAPIVQMVLDYGGPDAHWSEEKQEALGRQFLNTAIAIGNRGVGQIHLFLAAPNSLVLRFGRLYDKRNLPRLIVYQYQKEEQPPYPWGIRMPVQSAAQAELVW